MIPAHERPGHQLQVEQVAILGAGRVGTALARTLIDAGYDVVIAGSGAPALVEMITSVVAPGARAAWAEAAVAEADVVILALPLHRIESVDAAMLSGRLVVDAMNYWPPIDGEIAEFEGAPDGSSSVVQQRLPGARVVKTFNHTGYHDLEPDRRPARHQERRGMAVAGDQASDVAAIAGVIERIGYDVVRLHSLAEGRFLQPGEPPFGARMRVPELEEAMRRVSLTSAN